MFLEKIAACAFSAVRTQKQARRIQSQTALINYLWETISDFKFYCDKFNESSAMMSPSVITRERRSAMKGCAEGSHGRISKRHRRLRLVNLNAIFVYLRISALSQLLDGFMVMDQRRALVSISLRFFSSLSLKCELERIVGRIFTRLLTELQTNLFPKPSVKRKKCFNIN